MGGKASKVNGAKQLNQQDSKSSHASSIPRSRGSPWSSFEHMDSRDSSITDDCHCYNPFAICMSDNSHKRRRRNDPFGTPIPDTPIIVKKPPKSKQIYGGMEREQSSVDVLTREQRKWHRSETAGMHEGPAADKELLEKYELCEILGVGSTSTCHKCIERATGEIRACKIIDKKQIEQRFRGMVSQFHTEIMALRSLHHPNIITLYDVYVTDDKIYIIMELMDGGELFDYVVQKGTLTEEEASRIVRKITSALVYMHSKNIIHRDLKPENLLLKHKPRSPHDIEVKIIDFGLSKELREPVARSFLGTRGYIAPEMLQRKSYSRAVDAWALGVIVFVLLCGCLPFDDDSTMPTDEIVIRKFRLRFPRWAKNLSNSAKDILSKLLDINPNTRYTAEQALEHPWIKGIDVPNDVFLDSPGRISRSPKSRNGASGNLSVTKEHLSHIRENRARDESGNNRGNLARADSGSSKGNRSLADSSSVRGNRARADSGGVRRPLVRKTSI